MTINAPFRFARINRKVWFPQWGDLVSHDVPFKDGLCGTISLSITTKTPLLIGGERKTGEPGEVYPVRDENGHWAIPGSSLQGMVRQILEVAAFGKLGPVVYDRRFGVRDLTGKSETARQLYKKRMTSTARGIITSHSKAGWLKSNGKGGVEIIECHLARIEIDKVADLAQSKRNLTTAERASLCAHLFRHGNQNATAAWKDAGDRYKEFLGTTALSNLEFAIDFLDIDGTTIIDRDDQPRDRPHSRNNMISYIKCQPAGGGLAAVPGTLVLSGKSLHSQNPGYDHTKHMEFVFYGPNRHGARNYSKSEQISDDVWRDFLLIHDAETGQKAKPNPNWAFWKSYFEKGELVPVFFLKEERDGVEQITAIGMAQMFKLAMSLSTLDMLANSSAEHLDREEFDLPSLIFGATGGDGKRDSWFAHNLKRRAAFDLFRAGHRCKVQEELTANHAQTLLAPKPSYYPIYVRQNDQPNANRLYAAYHAMRGQTDPALTHPELAGTKVWPAAGNDRIKNVPGQGSLSNKLRTVPSDATFKGAMRIHNLRPVELGALLWALSYGEEDKYTHRLGGGKPLGLGEVSISIGELTLRANAKDENVPDKAELIGAFVEAMQGFYGEHWKKSPQIEALLKAAIVTDYQGVHELRYMQLDKPTIQVVGSERDKPGPNSYIGARNLGHIMDDFADNEHEIQRDMHALQAAELAARKKRAEVQVQEKKQKVETNPHLAFVDLVNDKFPNRSDPPTEFSGHPKTDAFAIGDRVTLPDAISAVIVGYPDVRSHPAELGKTKWVVGYENANGTKVVELRKQSDVSKVP